MAGFLRKQAFERQGSMGEFFRPAEQPTLEVRRGRPPPPPSESAGPRDPIPPPPAPLASKEAQSTAARGEAGRRGTVFHRAGAAWGSSGVTLFHDCDSRPTAPEPPSPQDAPPAGKVFGTMQDAPAGRVFASTMPDAAPSTYPEEVYVVHYKKDEVNWQLFAYRSEAAEAAGDAPIHSETACLDTGGRRPSQLTTSEISYWNNQKLKSFVGGIKRVQRGISRRDLARLAADMQIVADPALLPQEVATAGLSTRTSNKARNAGELRYFNGGPAREHN